MTVSAVLVRRSSRSGSFPLSLDSLARQTGLHPELVRRFVALGLLDASRTSAGELRFRASDVARLARAQRLRAGLGLNYASLGLVLDLLDRVAELEAALRRSHLPVTRSDPPWR